MKKLIAILALAGAGYVSRKHLVHLLTKLTGTWVGTPGA